MSATEAVSETVESAPVITDHSDDPGRREGTARRFVRNKAAVAGLVVLIVLFACALFGDVIAPYDPNEQDLNVSLQGPSWDHLLGTDIYGRDELSRLIAGAEVSIQAGFEATLIAFAIGVPLGMIAGFTNRILDSTLSRINEGLMAVPGVIFALAILAALGPSLTNAMLAIGILFVPLFFRVARAATVSVRQETYIEACEAIGSSRARTMLRHVFPNVLSPIVVQVAFIAGAAIVAEASLSFLGLGVAPPQASWGSMIQASVSSMEREPRLVLLPGLVIIITVMALTFVGDGLRDALGTSNRALAKEARA